MTDSLLALGCPDARLQILLAGAEALLADSFVMLPGQEGGLSEEEVTRVQAIAPDLRALCERLATYAVPHSLTHGDMWSGNIVWTGDGPVYFDWSDSSVSHPFIDLAHFLEAEEVFFGMLDAKGILANAYLDPWSRFERPERLSEVLALARPLACVYKAVFHHQFLLPMMENKAKWELALSIPHYLRVALNELDQLDGGTPIGA